MMKEIRRRVMDNENSDPYDYIYAVDAEIVVEDEGHIVYLHVQNSDDMIEFEATTESIYDYEEKLNCLFSSEDQDTFYKTIELRNRAKQDSDVKKIFGDIDIHERYAEQYKEMILMMEENYLKPAKIQYEQMQAQFNNKIW